MTTATQSVGGAPCLATPPFGLWAASLDLLPLPSLLYGSSDVAP
jgi:hypothetical protein